MSGIDDYLEEAITNIRDDRKVTKGLLKDVVVILEKDDNSHRDIGNVAAKYVETLQRSNEQLVKVIALLHKKSNSSDELTEKDKTEIFDLIQSENS
jgi:hypothetical protein|tara:strand:+ start:139 stop:426 length:288 start_codon:yes stop_codon:yes gene_type:complete